MNVTPEQIPQIVNEAISAARTAGMDYFQTVLKGQDRYACGFASTKIYKVKGNTKLGKALIAAGFRRSYDRSLELWDPSGVPCQNVDAKEAGARAAADVFRKYGFQSYAWSRLD